VYGIIEAEIIEAEIEKEIEKENEKEKETYRIS
jgi:hypothetical protein